MTSRLERYSGAVLLLGFAALTLLPFLSILSASLQESGEPVSGLRWPSSPHWENYAKAWSTGGFASLVGSSAFVGAVVVPVSVLLAVMAGYALAVLRPAGANAILAFFLLGLTLPVEAAVIPLYYNMRSVGLVNTHWALILPLIGLFMPFGVFWMRAAFAATPRSLVEAAQLDGATNWQILWRVVFPTVRPAVATLVLLYFMWSWNQFLLALILIQDPARRTAPAGLGRFIQEHGMNVPLLSAGTVIIITPVVLVYLLTQRHFVRGMLEGALKG
ncbi:carbohydrate ABC transporter permease [Spirillospora sp. CA-294931]|uniref:carbohydrate ABC transporter permease n=1 Tax=Spirillospora sp. CA-294931 TaxID=3240042 RepID=UPI003D8A1EFB